MVRAILAGTKTQTRRVVKDRHIGQIDHSKLPGPAGWSRPMPYGKPGDRLWVRETWQAVSGNDRARHIMTHPRPDRGWLEYAATPRADEPAYKWRPSIHMPRWASRITLEVTGVRVERLQDISEADAISEGTPFPCGGWVGGYQKLWESIHGPGSWEANPWVWVVEFKRVSP